MKIFKNNSAALAKSKARRRGQTTTEYVLLLLFVVIAVKSVGGTLKTKLNDVMNAAFGKVETEVSSSN